MPDIRALCWPTERLAEGLEALAQRAGYAVAGSAELIPAPPEHFDEDNWLELATGRMGLEVEAVQAAYPAIQNLLRRAAPALLAITHTDEAGNSERGYVLVLAGGWWRVRVLTPDLTVVKISVAALAQHMTQTLEAEAGQEFAQVLQAAGIPEERRAQAMKVLLRERLANVQVADCWLLRLPPSASFWRQLRQTGALGRLLTLFSAHAVYQGLQIAGWWVIVWTVFNGAIENAWLWVWILVLLTAVPFELLVLWAQNQLMVNAGALLKQRLLFGALQLRPEEIRHQGLGQFLSRVLEAETLETLVLGGGFSAAIALIELLTAAVVLGLGAGGMLHVGLLVLWLGVAVVIAWRFYDGSQRWRSAHRVMINTLIERMVGHRTRLAQERPQDWHDDEDQLQARYLSLSKDMDSSAVQISGIWSRGWLVLGLAGMAYPLISSQFELTALALSLGGVMLAAQALNHLATGMESLLGVVNAWRQVGPLFHAAPRINAEPAGSAATLTGTGTGTGREDSGNGARSDDTGGRPLLVAKDLSFRYREFGQPVLQACNLTVHSGDRLLLQGGSGGGKSTLAALLAGLRLPSSGLLMLRGLDRQTLGARAWRKKVVAAPQFHENHILTETLAFNLLMGRRWPPAEQDLQEAETLCEELGLGDLLRRMPAGLHQMVGESGWQLSHGERSRLYIARALLQSADLIILDESFAALDPANLERALRCVLQRAPALLVIAHP